ncbi:MAG: T9SS type A sorting domain-containing protein [Bacteroidota bacterium]|nr:T9SS type A sorting domain-containing protein [Bacteroidota bacterium]
MKNTIILFLAGLLSQFSASSLPDFSFPPTADFAQFRSNLYIVTPRDSTVLMDGTLTQYDDGYSNAVDGMDARKLFNGSENFGMLRGNTILIVERRQTIRASDSIFFKMWNMRVITYQLELIASNLNKPGRVGVLEDKFLHTSTTVDLNGTSRIRFSVTKDPASKAPDRFTVIFFTLPFTFTSVKASEQNNSVNLEWKTANENNLKEYNVESSVDGKLFEKAGVISADNSSFNNYQWTDASPAQGNNYYRIRSVETNGNDQFSDILKINIEKRKKSIYVFPNPVIGNNINLQMVDQPAGRYEITLSNSSGQMLMSKSIQHPGGSAIQNINPTQTLSRGIYQLEIKTQDGQRKIIRVVF